MLVRASGSVLRTGEGAARERADMGQHGVDHKEQHTRDDASPDRSADHSAVLLHAPGTDIQADDNAEHQRRDGVHGVVSRQKAGGYGLDRGLIACAGRSVPLQRIDHTPHKGDHDQANEDGTHDLAQPVSELLRPQGHDEGQREKHQRIDQLIDRDGRAAAYKGGHRHLKGCAGGTRNGQDRGRWPDRRSL